MQKPAYCGRYTFILHSFKPVASSTFCCHRLRCHPTGSLISPAYFLTARRTGNKMRYSIPVVTQFQRRAPDGMAAWPRLRCIPVLWCAAATTTTTAINGAPNALLLCYYSLCLCYPSRPFTHRPCCVRIDPMLSGRCLTTS